MSTSVLPLQFIQFQQSLPESSFLTNDKWKHMTTAKSKDINHTVYYYFPSYNQVINEKSLKNTLVQKYEHN